MRAVLSDPPTPLQVDDLQAASRLDYSGANLVEARARKSNQFHTLRDDGLCSTDEPMAATDFGGSL
jgi:hypothetical protein